MAQRGNPTPDAGTLDHIGWHSVLNLVMSQRAHALVGSLMSQWVMATLGMMHRHHGRPVTMCALRRGWRSSDLYAKRDAEYVSEDCAARFPRCTPRDTPR